MEQPEISIRPALLEDMPAINRIYNLEIAEGVATWDTAPWSLEQREAWFAAHDDLTPILVAEHAGEVIGFVYATLMSTKHGWRFTREDTIYVDQRYRGMRVGDRLLPVLLDRLRAIGARLVVASITSSNEASMRLHRKYGFEVVGEMKNAGYKFGEWLSATYMQTDLGTPAPEKQTW